MTNYPSMAELKRAYLGCAGKTYVLLDSAKVGASGLLRFGSLSDADAVVMDADPTGAVAVDVVELDCELVLAEG